MARSDFKEISAGQFFSITGGLIAGILLAYLGDEVMLIPGLLILIPGFLEMRGNISGSLSSRLSSALHMGYVKPELRYSKFMKSNILASFMLGIVASVAIGAISLAVTIFYFHVFYIKIVYISLIAAIISNMILIPLTVITCFWLFRKGHDPDNIMGPYVTTVGDIASMISLFIALAVVI